jgi:CheY-like chemotaxis protein
MSAILYVEDDELTRQTVSNRLRRLGYDVTGVESGEAALEAAIGTHPALALLDLELPGIDGVETLRQLRQRLPGLPAVVCSARLNEAGLRQQLSGLGLIETSLVLKPARFAAILTAVTLALEDDPSARGPDRTSPAGDTDYGA